MISTCPKMVWTTRATMATFGVVLRLRSLQGLPGLAEMARRELRLPVLPIPQAVESCRSLAERRVPEMGLSNQRDQVCQDPDTAGGLVRGGVAHNHVKDRRVRVGASTHVEGRQLPDDVGHAASLSAGNGFRDQGPHFRNSGSR